MLNEILTADRQENERRIEQFAEGNDICRGLKNETRKTCQEPQSLFTIICWLWTGSVMFLTNVISFFGKDRKYLRPVSESQSPFIKNCWLRTGSFLLL